MINRHCGRSIAAATGQRLMDYDELQDRIDQIIEQVRDAS
jgi:hypothetical protein